MDNDFSTCINYMDNLKNDLQIQHNRTMHISIRNELSAAISLLAEHRKTVQWAKSRMHLPCAVVVYRQIVADKKYIKILKGIKNALE